MNPRAQNNLKGIKVQINRLMAQEAALKHKLKKKENSERKARTRTLIQIGGLLTLTPILDLCDIQLGDDLQDPSNQHKADLLLGILLSIIDQLPLELSEEKAQKMKNLGKITRTKNLLS